MKNFKALATNCLFVLTLAALITPSISMAHPTIGVSVANAAIEAIATSAPLPNLDGSGLVITPQLGLIKTELTNKPGVTDTVSPKPSYSGEASGNSIGLGVNFPSHGDLSFFLYATTAQQTGEFRIDYDSPLTVRYTDFKASGTFAFAAAQYRLVGDDKSIFALGVFGGPGYYSFQSKVTYNQEGAGMPASTVNFNPSGFGGLFGLQIMFRVGGFRINPYLLGFTSGSENCQPIDLTGGGQLRKESFNCGGTEGRALTPVGFGGMGVVVGYRYFRLKVLSYLPAQDAQPLTVSSYSLSYGFEF